MATGYSTPTTTLLDLVTALAAAGASDREVVVSVLDLIDSGRVRLSGQARAEGPGVR